MPLPPVGGVATVELIRITLMGPEMRRHLKTCGRATASMGPRGIADLGARREAQRELGCLTSGKGVRMHVERDDVVIHPIGGAPDLDVIMGNVDTEDPYAAGLTYADAGHSLPRAGSTGNPTTPAAGR